MGFLAWVKFLEANETTPIQAMTASFCNVVVYDGVWPVESAGNFSVVSNEPTRSTAFWTALEMQ